MAGNRKLVRILEEVLSLLLDHRKDQVTLTIHQLLNILLNMLSHQPMTILLIVGNDLIASIEDQRKMMMFLRQLPMNILNLELKPWFVLQVMKQEAVHHYKILETPNLPIL